MVHRRRYHSRRLDLRSCYQRSVSVWYLREGGVNEPDLTGETRGIPGKNEGCKEEE